MMFLKLRIRFVKLVNLAILKGCELTAKQTPFKLLPLMNRINGAVSPMFCYPFNDMKELPSGELLLPAEEAVVTSPHTIYKEAEQIKLELPEVRSTVLEKVIVQMRSSGMIWNSQVLVDRYPFDPEQVSGYKDGIIREHSQHFVLAEGHYDEEINEGLILFGRGETNYYHWMVEYFPKLLLYYKQTQKRIPILVSESTQELYNLNFVLTSFAEKHNLSIQYLNPEIRYRINKATTINYPSQTLFILARMSKYRIEHSFFRIDVLHQVRDHVISLASMDNSAISSTRRIFITRRQGMRRNYNQDEVRSWFESKGFEAIYPEDLSVTQQCKLFSQAEMIAGPTGAAWTNLMFCRPGTKALCWMDEFLKEFSVFSTLADIFEVEMKYHLYKTPSDKNFHADYTVDINEISKTYDTLVGTTQKTI